MKKKEYQKKIQKEKNDMKEYRASNAGINLKTFLIISVCVISFVLLMFVFTKIKTGEWHLFTKENAVNYTAEVQDVKILCGSIFNREDPEYYVLAYNLKDDSASMYEPYLEKYNQGLSILKLYKLDLGNSRNNICLGETNNITDDITSLKLTNPTLIKIKDHHIVENYAGYDAIKNVLSSSVLGN